MSDRYFLLHAPTGESWQVTDPVGWCLEHRLDPLLSRGRERLVTLGPEDGDRIVRLVTRRCGLVLIDLASPWSVVVHHWAEPPPDIREFLKNRGLAKHEVKVALANTKNEVVALRPGSDFLHGEPARPRFPWRRFEAKWRRLHVQEPDDWQAAPLTWNTLCWDEADQERVIPWIVLKSIWPRDQAPPCPNCDTPLVVLRFLWVLPILFSGIRRITRGCFGCHQEFTETVEWDFWAWLVKTLNYELLPTHQYGTKKYDLRWRYPPPKRG